MSLRIKLIPRIALFSALIYVLSWGTSFLPNINFIFFIIFIAGFMWGIVPGIFVGGVGMGLWTAFHPYGPAAFPVMLSQIIGASLSGIVGGFYHKKKLFDVKRPLLIGNLVLASVICTLVFYLPVNIVDAWVFQPFKERFIAGSLWSLISVAANIIIFPLLFVTLKPFLSKERENL